MASSKPPEDGDGNAIGATPDDEAQEDRKDRLSDDRRQRRRDRWSKVPSESDVDILDPADLIRQFDSDPRDAQDDRLRIFVHRSCRQRIADHLSEQDTELGGLLIGRIFGRGAHVIAVEVCRAVRSHDYETTQISLAMDAGVWTLAREQLNDGEAIVGWYHSHPDLGAFFSGTDQRTQSTVFPHRYSVALVSDPIRDEERWFVTGGALEIEPDQVVYV